MIGYFNHTEVSENVVLVFAEKMETDLSIDVGGDVSDTGLHRDDGDGFPNETSEWPLDRALLYQGKHTHHTHVHVLGQCSALVQAIQVLASLLMYIYF